MLFKEREAFYCAQMLDATSRLANPLISQAVGALLSWIEATMVPGQERAHLQGLLRAATYRGTDVRFLVDLGSEESPDMHEILTWQGGGT